MRRQNQFGRAGTRQNARQRLTSSRPRRRAPLGEVGLALAAVVGLAYVLIDRGYIDLGPALLPQVTTHAAPEMVERSFALCTGSGGTCVIDGDTIRIDGQSIRIADIDTPEVRGYACPAEQALGQAATRRMIELLNLGAFELGAYERDQDVYGRKLRILRRNGQSLGMILVAEGLARPWDGARRSWC